MVRCRLSFRIETKIQRVPETRNTRVSKEVWLVTHGSDEAFRLYGYFSLRLMCTKNSAYTL